ncbi:MAG: response regulator [Deltaproteobacteria bacterium]|nr:response regulator [Deltaproteobacteria bacterium]
MKLFYKLLLLTLVPLTLTILSIVLVNWHLTESVLSEQVDKNVRAELGYYAEKIDAFFQNRVAELQGIAASPLVKKFDRSKVLNYLANEQKRLSVYIEGLYYNEADGTVHAVSGKTFSVRDRYYFSEIDRGRVVITKLIKSRATRRPIVLILVPIFNERGLRVGAIGGTILVEDLLRMVTDVKVLGSGFTLLADEEDHVISKILPAPDTADDGTFRPLPQAAASPGLTTLLEKMRSGTSGSVNLTHGGSNYHVHFQPLTVTKWRLALFYNEEDIFQVGRLIRNISLGLLLLALVVVFFITYGMNRILLAPIRDLIGVHRQLGDGNLQARATPRSRDEIGELSRSFNYMTDLLTRELLNRKQAEEQYRSIFENTIEGIFQSTTKGNFLKVNPALVRMYGFDTPQELMTAITNIKEQLYVNPEDRGRLGKLLEEQGAVSNFETQLFRRDKSVIWISMNARVVRDAAGQSLYYEGTVEDITERKKAEEEKIKLESQLRQGQKMEAIGTLAGGIAHDFNNLLTSIIGFGNLLQMDMDPDDPRKIYLDQILAASEKAAGLTQSLLAFSRKQVMELKPRPMNTILKGMEKLLRRLLTEDIEFSVVPADPDIIILADVTQIDQVLMNLASNARDAMPQGGRLLIEARKVRLEKEFIQGQGYGEPGDYALISVADTGTGMTEQTLEKIFDPFFTTKEVGKGTGLGLSIVYGIIKQHNGYIQVDSAPGRGTVFHIYLPTVKARVEEITPSPREIIGGAETILVAEDNPEVRKLTREVLTRKGYQVIEAVDGEQAIQKFLEHREAIDLLLLDVVMPKKNGKEVYEEIIKINPAIKVIFSSGYTGDVVIDKGVHEEAMDFIQKPLSVRDLLLKVREVLDR